MTATSTSGPKSLREYLRRYESNGEEEQKKRKKRKKRKKKVESKPDAGGVLVVDEDPVWQKPVKLEEESDDSADEEKPQVDEDIEVKRMRRLEQLKARRPYNAISEDGSGWVSLSPQRGKSSDPNSDISPPRKQRVRNDTPSTGPDSKPSGSSRENIDLSPSPLNSDMSPPRKQRIRNDTPSPEPRVRPSESDKADTDLSPPRQRQKRHHTPSPDVSPPRRVVIVLQIRMTSVLWDQTFHPQEKAKAILEDMGRLIFPLHVKVELKPVLQVHLCHQTFLHKGKAEKKLQ